MNFVQSEKVSLASHPDYDEAWVEETIEKHSAMLELGPLSKFQRQRPQKGGGRLDLLADSVGGSRRFVIEIMLGELDASHFMRVMDYWLREKNESDDSGLELVAVLAAEKVHASRYYALIQFLAQKLDTDLPLIVLEMTALKVGESFTLHFSKVIDGPLLANTREERPTQKVPTDRAYWENRSSVDSMMIVERVMAALREIDPTLSVRYNVDYINVVRGNKASNFAWFTPRKKFVQIDVKISKPEDWESRLSELGVDVTEAAEKRVSLRLKKEQMDGALPTLKELLKASYQDKFRESNE